MNFFMKLFKSQFFVILLLLLGVDSCSRLFSKKSIQKVLSSLPSLDEIAKNLKRNQNDPSSFSQAEGAIQFEIMLDLDIDMVNKIFEGMARIKYRCTKASNFIVLDMRDLIITKILDEKGKPLNFMINQSNNTSIGAALLVQFTSNCELNSTSFIDVYYKTVPNTVGIHFSDPSVLHSKNKTYTFMYTHGEPIYGRSIFPCQDTPSLKVASKAKLRVDDPYTALYSGEFVKKEKLLNGKNEYSYVSESPIPTYDMSLAAGVIEKVSLPNSRCEVWGEKELLSAVEGNFDDCEKFIKYYEQYRPLAFKRMVFLITPNDYPFSGMENPFLIYIARSVLSKDKSFSQTISHEISHFWSGNLVTNLNWQSFWLNEGITTYLSRKADRATQGDELYFFELSHGLFKLKTALKELKMNHNLDPSFRSLTPKIQNDDPYCGFSRIPYEKGSFFMYYIESLIGENVMKQVLSKYFKTYSFQSIDYQEFIKFLQNTISILHPKGKDIISQINWKEWLTGTEMIPVEFNFPSIKVKNFDSFIKKFKSGEISYEELEKRLTEMKTVEKERVVKELFEHFNDLSPQAKQNAEKIIDNKSLLDEHILTKTARLLLKAMYVKKEDRIKYLLEVLDDNHFFKVSFMKKVFTLLMELNHDKNFLMNILNSYKSRVNPITYMRIKEHILK